MTFVKRKLLMTYQCEDGEEGLHPKEYQEQERHHKSKNPQSRELKQERQHVQHPNGKNHEDDQACEWQLH